MTTRPITIGLTGSIGMGKSTTAGFFREMNVPVWDADEAVHRLYGVGGAAVAPLAEICPQAIRAGSVDRTKLKGAIAADPALLGKIETIVHPLVASDRAAFLATAKSEIVVLDSPLLFETGAEDQVDYIVVVSAPAELQRERVLARGTMSEAQFETILGRQMPDDEKRKLADYVIETVTLEGARRAVQSVLADIRNRVKHA